MFSSAYKNKKVFITGDTGFKGSWLAIWLKLLGAEVYGYSLPAKTTNDNYIKCKLESEYLHQDGDVRDLENLNKFIQSVNPDIAFHLAAQPIVLESYTDPVYTFETNLIGTVNFLEAVRNTASLKSAVVVTSDKAYQNKELDRGYKETDRLGGHDPYSSSKACSELITESYNKSFFIKESDCNLATARAGNVIGGGDWAENRIVPDYFRAMIDKTDLELRNPNSTRPWQHVLESLSGYLHLGASLFGPEGADFSGAWNFGPDDSSEKTVFQLVSSINEISGPVNLIINDQADKKHEAKLLKLDISKAKNYLHWRPNLNFEETIEFTAKGYLNELDGSNILEARKKQILDYTDKAIENKIRWTEKTK